MYMKKLFLLILCVVHCALCIDLRAQDDAESIVSGDIEVEGLDNFWVESRLITGIDKITPSASLVPLKQGDNMEGAQIYNEKQGDNIETQNSQLSTLNSFKSARPAGGNVAFLTHVQKYMSKVFNVLLEKYPEEMLGRIGTRTEVEIDFKVTSEGSVVLLSITNGAVFGMDVVVVEKMFKTYKKWYPAKVDGVMVDSELKLIIDVSI